MLLSSTKTQLRIMFRTREYQASILIFFAYACLAFIYSVTEALRMGDLAILKDANQYICYSQYHRLAFFFLLLFPFLIVLPFATSYIDDYRNYLLPVYLIRCRRRDYYISKFLACFTGTFLVVFLPFFCNLLLCNLFLPHNYNTWLGEYQLGNYYRTLLGTSILFETPYPRFAFFTLFLNNPFLYNLLYLLFLSLFAGLMGTFILSISFLLKKKKLLLFLPVFVILQVLNVYSSLMLTFAIGGSRPYINFNILEYVIPTMTNGKSPVFFLLFAGCILASIAGMTALAIKRDLESLQ